MKSKTDQCATLDEIAEKCCAVLQTDPRVSAICLVGSLARGDADANSDVDLCVFVDNGQLDSLLAETARIATRVGQVLVSGWLHDSTSFCALYDLADHIIKVDFDFFEVEQLPGLMMKGMSTQTYLFDHRLVYDRHDDIGPMLEFPPRSPAVAAPLPSPSSLAIAAWSVLRMTRRGEYLEALDIINHMRDPFLTKLLCNVYDLSFQNYRRMEGRLPRDIVERLNSTFPRPIRDELLSSLRELIELYFHLLALLQEELSASESTAFSRAIREIDKLLGLRERRIAEIVPIAPDCGKDKERL